MTKLAVYPGTFDPITNGHIDLVLRAADLFDKIVVAVADNSDKKPLFDLEQRVALSKEALSPHDDIEVIGFTGLLTDLLQKYETNYVIRGLRAASDFEYEFMLAGMNRKLLANIENIYLIPSEENMYLSSSFVREISKLGGDVTKFVPSHVVQALQEKKR